MVVWYNPFYFSQAHTIVQWCSNQNVVLEFTMREISMLPTLKASWELKNWYFTMNFFPRHHLYVNNRYTKIQCQNIYQKKDIRNLLTCVVVKCFSLLPTLTTSQRSNYFFAIKIFKQKLLYINNMCSKFQGQMINTKKDIHNQPTCVVLRNNHRNHFITTNFETLPKVEKFLIYNEILVTKLFIC